jgi:RNA recognition motif-containing protein
MSNFEIASCRGCNPELRRSNLFLVTPRQASFLIGSLGYTILSLRIFPPFYKELLLVFTYRVTIMKDRKTRESKGVAFILYTSRDDAHVAVSY